MSDTEEQQKVCQTCSDFEPQTWRKSLCKNCFHSLDEHSPELLMQEAENVAKENSARKSTEASSEQPEAKPDSGKSSVQPDKEIKVREANTEATPEKGEAAKKVPRKYGAERAAAEGSSKWSWAIDLGRGYGKSLKPSSSDTTKVPSTTSSTATSTSSTKSSPQTSAKPSLKSTPSEPSVSTTTTSSAVSADPTPAPMSKAKNFASKFESKAQTLPKTKPTPRPPEIRPGSASIAALTGKLTDNAPGAKTHLKPAELQKTSSSKPDSKDTKVAETASKFSKTGSTAAKDDSVDTSKNIKLTPQAGKLDDKISQAPAGQPKTSPFGKDLLKSTKDASKRDGASVISSGKPESVASSAGKEESSVTSAGKLENSVSFAGKTESSASSAQKTETSVSSAGKLESSVSSASKPESSLSSDEKPESSITSAGKPESSISSIEKQGSSTNSITYPESSSESSVEKQNSSTVSFVEKDSNTSSVSKSEYSLADSLEITNVTQGKESVKYVSPEELTPLLVEKDNSGDALKGVFERVIGDGKTEEEAEAVPSGGNVAEVGQRNHGVEISLVENSGYLARDSGHAKIGLVGSIGDLASGTGSDLDVGVCEESGGKEGAQASTDKDDVIGEGRDNAGAESSDGEISDVTSGVVQEQETAEVVREKHVCETATSVSSSPAERDTTTKQTTTTTSTTASTTASRYSQPAPSVSQSTSSASSSGVQTKHLPLDSAKNYSSQQSPVRKFNDPKASDVTTDNDGSHLSITSPIATPLASSGQKNESSDANTKEDASEESAEDVSNEIDKLNRELKEKDDELLSLTKQLSRMDEQVKVLEEERNELRRATGQTQKEDIETLLSELRAQLSKMEQQCSQLEKDNQSLLDKLHAQEEMVKRDMESRGKNSDNSVLEEDLEAAEKELEDVKEENKELQRLIMEMKNEMDEMYDHFRENEHDEFRELEKELDLTAKNCRILQFKLRKAERRNEQIEQDRLSYEDKLRVLQDQFESQDAKNHIRLLEEELRMAKEVSVRLHDELDLLEDKKNKAAEESRHLTELLEHTDKRQFRMEMEIDKLRDVVSDLKQQLKEAKSGSNKETTPDRKPPLGAVGKQGSREYDVSQLMKDLVDSMERENDLKDQLKFTEEEAKMMRRRVSEMDEENENLRIQLQKMSEKASKHKMKEKERQKELEEERRHSESFKTALSAQGSQDEDREDMSSDVILIVGPEGSDVMNGDEIVHLTQRKDSTDEDLMNVLQMRVQLEMLEHELMTSHQKLDGMDLEHENLQAEVKFLQERLAEKETCGNQLGPSTPNAYYEDKLKEMSQEADELRWKLIEKDRELERLSVVQTRHGREHGHKKEEKLKKSKSLEETDVVQADLKKQMEISQMDILRLKRTVEELTQLNSELKAETEDLQSRTPIPSVLADDAAVENIELKENLRKMEETSRAQVEKIRALTENLQKLARDGRSFTSIATSPTAPGTLSIPGIPQVELGNQTARVGLGLPNPGERSNARDLNAQSHVILGENVEAHSLVRVLGATCTEESTGSTPTAASSQHKAGSILQVSSKPPTETKTLQLTSTTDGVNVRGPETLSKTTSLNADSKSISVKNLEPLELVSSQTIMDSKSLSGSKVDAGGKTKDAGDKDDNGTAGEDVGEKEKSTKAKDDGLKSILLEYPEGKSKVIISGTESRVELMEKVLEMDEEIGDLLSMMSKREDECERMRREVKYLNSQLRQLKDESRRTELDLLQELDMMHDKNSVMSNLLDIINERAEAAEEELERRMQEDPTHSPTRSASNVSQVSALSDTSVGSDEVFLTAYVSKEGVITRDWETKLKVRIESLERLLAEERQKVSMAEKKLLLAGIDSVSPSVSDDVKLRIREKELLQEELLTSQRHLHIATDQINGLKARVHILEDEHTRLKADYAKLYDEMDKPLDKQDGSHLNSSDSEKTLEDKSEDVPFVAKRISVVEAPKFRELRRAADDSDGSSDKISKLEEELLRYKQIAKELEYKVEEIDDIWRSKSSASEKERDELDKQVREKVQQITLLEEAVENLKKDLSANDKMISAKDAVLIEKEREIARLAGLAESREGEKKRLEQEKESLLGQISQRDTTIKGLNDTMRIRDERLKEKDEILFKLNTSIEQQKVETNTLTSKLSSMAGQLKEQAAKMAAPRSEIPSSVPAREIPRGCQTDAEKESFRLKETVRKLQGDLEKVVGDKRALETSLEKSRKSLDEAMLMWDKDRNSLQRDANILEEKVRLYEAFNSMNKDETIETLKTESHGYFREKEALLCELSSVRMKHETDERVHKEQVAKLQVELTDKLRLLKTEVDSNSHITTEMNRLKRQAEMAYRLQQEQRIFKAEHLAMKVRYETRIDKLSKEHNKMLLTIDKLQKERDMDKQIIDGVQKNMNLVKESYTEELARSQEDKTVLRRYVKEIEELRVHLDELQRHIRDLRDKTVDQERLRSDLINKFATDRSSWEIDRANLVSQVNQLEERIYSSSRQQERSKDIQVNMGMAWEKERREQQRLLSEAHTLALDLQDQLRSRDEAFAHDRKEILRQIEIERVTWAKEKRDAENEAMEMRTAIRRVTALEKKLKDIQEKSDKDVDVWNKEKVDLLSLAAEARHAHARDTKQVEYVLSRLIRLRELGIMLTSQPKWDSLEEKPPDRPENTDQSIVDFVKEAVLQICQVADDLIILTNPASDEEAIKRISSSEIDLLKQQYSVRHHEADDVVVIADVSTSSIVTKTRIEEESAGVSRRLPNDAILIIGPNQPHATAFSETITKSTNRAVLSSPTTKQESPPSVATPTSPTTQSSTVILRPSDAPSRDYYRSPSYASGTRSAHSSRATTPEVPDPSHKLFCAPVSRKLGFTEPDSTASIPRQNVTQTQKQKSQPAPSAPPGYSSNERNTSRRPGTFLKSLSVDSATIIDSSPDNPRAHQLTTMSASNTPTQPTTSAEMASLFSAPSVIPSQTHHHLIVSKDSSLRKPSSAPEKFSPRTTRRIFFECYPASVSSFPTSLGYQSWPERRSVTPALHVRQTSLPDPEEVRREAEEEHDLVSSKLESRGRYSVMKSSTSWDEQMHRQDVASKETSTPASPTQSAPSEGASISSQDDHQPGSKHSTAKEKRRLFKKASSVDSTIGSSLAKVGVSAITPGAPTGFAPSELFAAVKGKLKPVFKKKSPSSGSTVTEPRSPSPLFIQTDVPDIHFAGHGGTSLPVPAPHVDVSMLPSCDQGDLDELTSDLPEERSPRDSHRTDIPRGKWRSKSADRAQGGINVRADVVRTAPGVWQFNETAV